jgi:hypothetical protein
MSMLNTGKISVPVKVIMGIDVILNVTPPVFCSVGFCDNKWLTNHRRSNLPKTRLRKKHRLEKKV